MDDIMMKYDPMLHAIETDILGRYRVLEMQTLQSRIEKNEEILNTTKANLMKLNLRSQKNLNDRIENIQ